MSTRCPCGCHKDGNGGFFDIVYYQLQHIGRTITATTMSGSEVFVFLLESRE